MRSFTHSPLVNRLNLTSLIKLNESNTQHRAALSTTTTRMTSPIQTLPVVAPAVAPTSLLVLLLQICVISASGAYPTPTSPWLTLKHARTLHDDKLIHHISVHQSTLTTVILNSSFSNVANCAFLFLLSASRSSDLLDRLDRSTHLHYLILRPFHLAPLQRPLLSHPLSASSWLSLKRTAVWRVIYRAT